MIESVKSKMAIDSGSMKSGISVVVTETASGSPRPTSRVKGCGDAIMKEGLPMMMEGSS